jgi:hypothetical protein
VSAGLEKGQVLTTSRRDQTLSRVSTWPIDMRTDLERFWLAWRERPVRKAMLETSM